MGALVGWMRVATAVGGMVGSAVGGAAISVAVWPQAVRNINNAMKQKGHFFMALIITVSGWAVLK